MDTTAVIFEQPGALRVDKLALTPPGEEDLVVDIRWSGISTGTEKLLWQGEMPWFPGLGYPLVPGYEAVGEVTEAPAGSRFRAGDNVFVPGATCYQDARGLFGGTAQRVVVPANRVTPVDTALGDRAILLSLAATAQHALASSPSPGKTLIVGHGVVGRLLARLMIARGDAPPTVWEKLPARQTGADGYVVADADSDPERSYETVIDATGDPGILDTLIGRLARQGEIVLAGFYSKPLAFTFPPAFMREARLRIAAEWRPADLDAVRRYLEAGQLSLDGLISHRSPAADAARAYAQAFGDPTCTKMILEWRPS